MKIQQSMGRTIAMLSILMPLKLYAAIHYVDLNSATPVAPYTCWATAATNIQQAVGVSLSGDTVLITNGTYRLSAQINVTKAITIKSVNGPEVTIIDGGGAVRCFSLGNTHSTLSGLTISNGFTDGDGGGIYCTSKNPIVTNCVISGNSADGYGGGMRYGTANNCTISGNSAGSGGGISYGSANNCVISGNAVSWNGGGINYGTAINCTISGNSAVNGGGMFDGTASNCMIIRNYAVVGGGLRRVWVNNCTISGNSASNSGGGMNECTVNNSTISGNAASWGGGIDGGSAYNCTISGNSASFEGGGMHYGEANNCIIWCNESNEGNNLQNTSTRNCSSPDVLHGTDGNITNAPLLLFASHIATNSPCRAAGNAAFSSGTDIDGQAWLNPPSIGCDEPYGEGSFTGPIKLTLSEPPDLISAGYQIEFLVVVQGRVTETRVTFGDGKTATNVLYYFDHIWETEGDYDVIFTAFNDSYPDGISATQTVHVVTDESSTIYVSGTTGNDTADGRSWATAKQTIQAGVDAQNVTGGMVIISNGTYVVGSEINVAKDVRIESVNGPNSTIIDGGGAVRCFSLGNTHSVLKGLTITNGFATDGGGIYCSGYTPIITNCLIIGNSAKLDGGGMHKGTANNCTISRNSAGDGGGMFDGTANNCTISGNSAGKGGGIYGTYSFLGTANNCTISGNSADVGGGLFSGTANNCMITGNSARLGGGAYYTGILNNCAISGNSASDGGGMAGCTANNCTISGNTATNTDGGVAAGYGSSAIWGFVNNCIIWHNKSGDGINLSEDVIAINCSSPDVPHGVDGNNTNAPMLLSASHIATNSPCRGAGNPAFSSGTDIDGQAWLNPPSIGCDESYGPGSFTGEIELALSGPTNLFSARYPVSFTATVQGSITETQIAFGDGEIATNLFYMFEHAWATGGDYDVVLTAFNDSYPGGISATQTVHVVSEDISALHVSAATGNDAADGLSWATAKQTIQAGVDAQNVLGGWVIISNGIYVVSSEISVDKEIRLVGLNGPNAAIVDGGGSNRCFNLGNSPCLLSGLTITNGFTIGDGGGIYCSGIIPMITNCVISGNSAANGGGIFYGTANHCAISRNSGADYGGGMSYGRANHCTISGNSAENGGGMYSGTANNCAISGNSVASGGGIFYGTANNCVIRGNSASNSGGGICFGSANNCVISENSASYSGGGIYQGTADNCIIWHNESINYNDLRRSFTRYCSSPDAAHGVNGNSTNAPLFIDKDAGNYRLQSNSPCINWGNSSYVNSPMDLDGNPRIVGAYVDMGAYEYQTDLGADGDNDGMPDEWERAFFGFNILPLENADHDAHSNVDEYIAGTDPANAASFFRATFNSSTNGNPDHLVITWEAVTGRVYNIYWTPSLMQDFQPLELGIPYPQNSYTALVHSAESSGFYRVVVMRADYDADGDGLPNEWESHYAVTNALADVDNDGFNNLSEFIAGTDPTNETSYFTTTSSVDAVNGTTVFVVEWISIPDRLYSIQWSTNLVAGFQPLQAGIEYPQNSYIVSTHHMVSNGFYQVDVRLR